MLFGIFLVAASFHSSLQSDDTVSGVSFVDLVEEYPHGLRNPAAVDTQPTREEHGAQQDSFAQLDAENATVDQPPWMNNTYKAHLAAQKIKILETGGFTVDDQEVDFKKDAPPMLWIQKEATSTFSTNSISRPTDSLSTVAWNSWKPKRIHFAFGVKTGKICLFSKKVVDKNWNVEGALPVTFDLEAHPAIFHVTNTDIKLVRIPRKPWTLRIRFAGKKKGWTSIIGSKEGEDSAMETLFEQLKKYNEAAALNYQMEQLRLAQKKTP